MTHRSMRRQWWANVARSMARCPARGMSTSCACAAAKERPQPGDLNHYSRIITQPKDQGASQAMLYATHGIESDSDLKRAMVGVASVWYEGNPCNAHLLGVGQRIRQSLDNAGVTGYQFGTVGVSDGISRVQVPCLILSRVEISSLTALKAAWVAIGSMAVSWCLAVTRTCRVC